jgi:hypothetical protein
MELSPEREKLSTQFLVLNEEKHIPKEMRLVHEGPSV